MPGGFHHAAVGYATFTAIKLIGYSAFADRRIAPRFTTRPRSGALVAGCARTGIGMLVGALYALTVGVLLEQTSTGAVWPLFLLGLVPMRFFEWWVLVRWLYDRQGTNPAARLRVQLEGTVFSFVLDIPAIAGLIGAGGLWIC